MITLPFLGRLSLSEWPVVVISLLFAYIESVISIITELIPAPVLGFITSLLKYLHTNAFRLVFPKDETEPTDAELNQRQLVKASNIHDICKVYGFEVEDHIVETKDKYLLTIHRIPPKKKDSPVVYLHHGLLMCSDIWFLMNRRDQNLPFILHDLGYDVWLGNNRGNKYSAKHLVLKPSETKFWDFSIDEFAFYDIPDSINYALKTSGAETLTYIGFSQGSAQAFASLSINAELNNKINLFLALAPAITPVGLHHRFVDALIKSSPNIMYLIFGKKTLLPTASFWASIIYPPLFVKVIDVSIKMLFNWKSKNIDQSQRISSFKHLYSPTSVKCIVHWFQIIRNGSFQLFDENVSVTNSLTKVFQPATFPTKTNIKVPVKLIYGDIDSLVNIDKYSSLLPAELTEAVAIPAHEHLDIIWGRDVDKLIFPHVLKFLAEHRPDSKSST
ncbi:hypothetical protein WICPIJ_001238 [Wickerhamomyces pijperi]|uniref:Partial AB-hydrolase lipase domain-containing protein n=1 Tax=Wickerhamomyces pijperi TaxID=599730 RepID=A0A9P8QE37_WICPI|nr:hypothetical protein WICPIJ_001238 [Wickerhamomyces pijperi]